MPQSTNTPDKSEMKAEFARGFFAGLDHIANFINSLDSSAIYSEWRTDQVPDMVEALLDAPLKNSPVNGGPQVNMTLRQWLEADTRVPHKRARGKALDAIFAALQAVPAASGEPTDAMIKAAASVAHERGCYGVTRPDLSAIIRSAINASGEE